MIIIMQLRDASWLVRLSLLVAHVLLPVFAYPASDTTNVTGSTAAPSLPEAISSETSTGLLTTAGVVALLAAPANPSLCAYVARTRLILDQARCAYADGLPGIAYVLYPFQVAFGDPVAGQYFAEALLTAPLMITMIALHYAVVVVVSRPREGELGLPGARNAAVMRDLAMQRFRFPSLSATSLSLLFTQPLVGSGVTELARGLSSWAKLGAMGVVLAAITVASFAVRWFFLHRSVVQYVTTGEAYRRRHAFLQMMREGKDVTQVLGIVLASPETPDPAGAAADTTPLRTAAKTLPLHRGKPSPRNKKAHSLPSSAKPEMDPSSPPGPDAPYRRLLPTDWIGPGQGETPLVVWPTGVPLSFFGSTHRWEDCVGRFGFVRKYGCLFGHYRGACPWFIAVEMSLCVVLGVIDGIKPATSEGCWITSLTVFILLLIYAVILLGLRPYSIPWDNTAFVALTALQVTACGFLIASDVYRNLGARETSTIVCVSCFGAICVKGVVDVAVMLRVRLAKQRASRPPPPSDRASHDLTAATSTDATATPLLSVVDLLTITSSEPNQRQWTKNPIPDRMPKYLCADDAAIDVHF